MILIFIYNVRCLFSLDSAENRGPGRDRSTHTCIAGVRLRVFTYGVRAAPGRRVRARHRGTPAARATPAHISQE